MRNRISQPIILKSIYRVMILAVALSIGLFTLLLDQETYADIPQEEKSKITTNIAKLHILFIANQGQVDKSVGYYTKTLGHTSHYNTCVKEIFLTSVLQQKKWEPQNLLYKDKG